MNKNIIKLGYALTDPGLIENTKADIRKEYSSWNDEQIMIEMKERLRVATLFNNKNKRARKRKGSGSSGGRN